MEVSLGNVSNFTIAICETGENGEVEEELKG
jgi:hypothetical protein